VTEAEKRSEEWRQMLSAPLFNLETRLLSRLASDPRCLLCNSPYGKPFGPILRRIGYGRSARYPQLCRPCFRHFERHPGGAEVLITVLFADVRGSTAIAERQTAEEFRRVLEGFYRHVTDVVADERGVIDKFLGDGVMALFIPSFTRTMHAARALAAGRRILAEADLPVGVGVNTGPAFTGFLGPSAEVASFTAVGDAVNVAHRLGEAAAAGEMLAASTTFLAAEQQHPTGEGVEPRTLVVKGREQPVEAWSIR
jgi:adenylate cyclase